MTATQIPGPTSQQPDSQCWVLIESGSNQEYIFSSNRRAYAVGASHLLKQIPDWVRRAIASFGTAVIPVVITSSKAMLLVKDPEIGRTIIRRVTQRAVEEAPGLDLWGYVEPEPKSDPMGRLTNALAAHSEQRWRRPQPVARAPMSPFVMSCGFTGRPAELLTKRGDRMVPTSKQAAAILKSAKAARSMMADLLPTHPEVIASTEDGEELINAGWVAVIHVDGNQIGTKIATIDDVDTLRAFSEALEKATLGALREAVAAVVEASEPNSGLTAENAHVIASLDVSYPHQANDSFADQNELDISARADGWLLPLIVGGDDITVACDARHAVTFTRAYLTAFERLTASSPVIARIAKSTSGASHLTASGGIAVVKPHFPFGSAYVLANELARSTKHALKESTNGADHRSGYDFHVLRDSVVRSLSEMRLGQAGGISLDTGPWLSPPYTMSGDDETPWVVAHDDQRLIDQVADLLDETKPGLSQSESKRLKEALLAGRSARQATLERFAARSIESDNPFLLDDLDTPTLSYWPAATDMADIATGTAARSGS